MKTHISDNGYMLKIKWRKDNIPNDYSFIGHGLLVNKNSFYADCIRIAYYHSPTMGYGII